MGAIVLHQYTVSKAGRDIKRQHSFRIVKGGEKSYMFAAESHDDMEKYDIPRRLLDSTDTAFVISRWAKLFTEAATLKQRVSPLAGDLAHSLIFGCVGGGLLQWRLCTQHWIECIVHQRPRLLRVSLQAGAAL